MKRVIRGVFGLVVLAVWDGTSFAQHNPRGTAKLTLNGSAISVEYGRPALNGRSVAQLLGRLNAGEVWRLGADQSTTFSTATDLAFGDSTVPKGEYSLWVRKEADGTWKLVFNKQHGQWGTEHDAAQDLVAVPLKEEKGEAGEKPAEQVTINLEKEEAGNEIEIKWGDMELSTYFKAK